MDLWRDETLRPLLSIHPLSLSLACRADGPGGRQGLTGEVPSQQAGVLSPRARSPSSTQHLS
jgi:hypothetical protein